MASSIARLFSSNLLRVRPVGSFSRFLNTKGFQYDQHDSDQDECILKCDDKHGSLVRDVINDAFSPCHSATANLARLLNMAENRIGLGPCKLPRWRVVEDDKALYLIRIMTGLKEGYIKEFDSNRGFVSEKHEKDDESVTKEFMSEKHEKDVDESVTKEFMSDKHEKDVEESVTKEFMYGELEKDAKESLTEREVVPKKVTERPIDFTPLLNWIRGDEISPSECYYHLMKDAKELNLFAEWIEANFEGMIDLSFSINVSCKLKNPKAIHIIIGLGGSDTDDPCGGYAIEIFLPEQFYKIEDTESNDTGGGINITIPKKKGKSIQTIEGNLIFFQESKVICKPGRIISIVQKFI
ncbi:hypothetical protein CTI12_AA535340 [Artemisia annua]|uniref:Uncharacterized protein n=1 Tax=Artemisia annua TaxID=35608 RepID=A0A2U1L1G3_ARTAN|nr:hypothetical protein CTI12_AA535340 [Artemisia annua]